MTTIKPPADVSSPNPADVASAVDDAAGLAFLQGMNELRLGHGHCVSAGKACRGKQEYRN